MTQPLRIIFAGTPDFAATHLQGILENQQHDVIAVYTQPDRPAGRGKKLQPSPVKQLALLNNIPVFQPNNFKSSEDQRQLQQLEADVMVVVAYGLLLPKVVLDTPRLGCINVHASLLPRWRGAAPIQRAIEAGDSESGVVIMQMDEGLDTGDMLLTARCDINANETGGTLHDKLATIGVPALNQTLSDMANNELKATKQTDESCYAAKISKQELMIDWTLPARVIHRKIRAFTPFPSTFSTLNNHRIKILQADLGNRQGEPGEIVFADKKHLEVACGDTSLQLLKIQMAGAKALDIPAVMNSKADKFRVGTRFDLTNAP